MLVLSRKVGEQIVIANDIVATVVEIRGDRVRLGIEADAKVPVHRREVFDAIQRDGEQCLVPHDESQSSRTTKV